MAAAARPAGTQPAPWAAAVEFVVGDVNGRNATQAAIAKAYRVRLAQLLPRTRQLRQTLHIQPMDERYSELQTPHIAIEETA